MIGKKLIPIITLLLFTSGIVVGQTYEQKRKEILNRQANTRAEINVLDARIKSYQKRVADAEAEYNKSYKQFENLNSLIALQDDKITQLEKEQEQIEAEIELTENEIEERQEELRVLIENYKKILLFAYKNGKTNNLELLLTAESFNQALVRSYYLKKFEEQKAKQAQQIRQRRSELDQVKIDLKQSLNRNEIVISEIVSEKDVLGDQRSKQMQTVENIKSQRSDLLAELQKNRREKENLENTFTTLINEEARIREAENERLAKLAEARRIADVDRRNSEVAKYSTPITRENLVSDAALLDYDKAFSASKGRLQWPVNSRTVSKKFGRTRNPVYGTYTEHLGINIVTEPASTVKAVADGYIISIAPINGYGDVVIVNHGSYFTTYGNLSRIDVGRYQQVRAGDTIGLSGLADSPLGENLFFMVRQKQENLNPQDWLVK